MADRIEHEDDGQIARFSKKETCRRLAYLTIVSNLPPREAKAKLGLSDKDYFACKNSKFYVIAANRYSADLEANREAFVKRMAGELDIMGEISIERLAEILIKSKNEKIVANVSMDTLDRIGMRAPDRVETKLEVSLSEDTLRRLESVLGELDRPPVDLKDWAFAMERETPALPAPTPEIAPSRTTDETVWNSDLVAVKDDEETSG